MKRSLKQTAGFTLVELIVVIAILGTLAGIAVPTYSGYVKKANMAADQTLASDIANAMQLQYYADPAAAEAGYIILKHGADPDFNAFGEKALKAAFGDNWGSAARLKYDGWKFDKALFNAMMGISNGYASSVPGSSYIQNVGPKQLLNDVQYCASSLARFLAGLDKYEGDGGAQLLNKFVTGDSNATGRPAVLEGLSDAEITADVLANATVFGLASTLNNTSDTVQTNFSTGYYIDRFHSTPINVDADDVLVDVANTYAALEAYVGYVKSLDDATLGEWGKQDKAAIIAEFDALNNKINSANGKSDVVDAFNTHGEAIYNINNYAEFYDGYKNGQAAEDGKAYIAIMQTVNGLGADYADELSNTELFGNNPELANRVNAFVAATDSSSNAADLSLLKEVLTDDAIAAIPGNSIVIAFSADGDSLPACSILFCDNR